MHFSCHARIEVDAFTQFRVHCVFFFLKEPIVCITIRHPHFAMLLLNFGNNNIICF